MFQAFCSPSGVPYFARSAITVSKTSGMFTISGMFVSFDAGCRPQRPVASRLLHLPIPGADPAEPPPAVPLEIPLVRTTVRATHQRSSTCSRSGNVTQSPPQTDRVAEAVGLHLMGTLAPGAITVRDELPGPRPPDGVECRLLASRPHALRDDRDIPLVEQRADDTPHRRSQRRMHARE